MGKKLVSAEEAREAIQDMTRRVALLHLAFSRTLVDELGEERGRDLIRKAIWDYGTRIGERRRQRIAAMGLEPSLENTSKVSDLSPLGWDRTSTVVDGEPRTQVRGCILAQTWKEYGEEELGDLYCLVDPANMQTYNPDFTMVHVKKALAGDEYCEIAIRRLAQEQE